MYGEKFFDSFQKLRRFAVILIFRDMTKVFSHFKDKEHDINYATP